VEELGERERETVARLRMKLSAGDTSGAKSDLDTITFRGLLDDEDQVWVDSVKAAL
jgi:hypothetical protein